MARELLVSLNTLRTHAEAFMPTAAGRNTMHFIAGKQPYLLLPIIPAA